MWDVYIKKNSKDRARGNGAKWVSLSGLCTTAAFLRVGSMLRNAYKIKRKSPCFFLKKNIFPYVVDYGFLWMKIYFFGNCFDT